MEGLHCYAESMMSLDFPGWLSCGGRKVYIMVEGLIYFYLYLFIDLIIYLLIYSCILLVFFLSFLCSPFSLPSSTVSLSMI